MMDISLLYQNISFNDEKIIIKLLNNFEKYYSINSIYFSPLIDKIYYSENISYKNIDIIRKIDIRKLILEKIYEINKSSIFLDIQISKKYSIVHEINVDVLPLHKNYIYYFTDDVTENNLNNIKLFNILINREINYYMYQKKLNNISKFNTDIINLFYNINIIVNSDEDIDNFLTCILELLCKHYKMTCGFIIEEKNNRYFPLITYNPDMKKCHYGFYEFDSNSGPWSEIYKLFELNKTNFLYYPEFPSEFYKYFKYGIYPKSGYISFLNYRKTNICLSMTNVDNTVYLDTIALSRLQIIFHTIYEIICKKYIYEKSSKIEASLQNKLINWKNESLSMSKRSEELRNTLQNFLLRESNEKSN